MFPQPYTDVCFQAVIDYMAHKDRPDQTDEQGNTKWVEIRKKEKKIFCFPCVVGQGNPNWQFFPMKFINFGEISKYLIVLPGNAPFKSPKYDVI